MRQYEELMKPRKEINDMQDTVDEISMKYKAEAIWDTYKRFTAEELSQKIGIRGGANAFNDLKGHISSAYRQYNICTWAKESSVPINDDNEENAPNKDTLCIRCASVAGCGRQCSWCSRLKERKDWKIHKVIGGSIRIEDCPAFQLWCSGRKDRAVAILCMGCVFEGEGLMQYWRRCTFSELSVWVDRYNAVIKKLGARHKDLIELRPFSGVDETWRLCDMGADGNMPSLAAR